VDPETEVHAVAAALDGAGGLHVAYAAGARYGDHPEQLRYAANERGRWTWEVVDGGGRYAATAVAIVEGRVTIAAVDERGTLIRARR